MAESIEQTRLPFVGETVEPRSGILPTQSIKAAIERRDIQALTRISDDQIQPASLDLRLGSIVYRVPASFLPSRHSTVKEKLDFLAEEKMSLENGAILRKGKVYVAQLQESLKLRKRMSALGNPKSSIGRIDVFSRIITDFGTEFDRIREKYNGPLWLEIAPRSFDVQVRTGSRLAQVRIKRGTPPSNDAFHKRLYQELQPVHSRQDVPDIRYGGIAVTVDVVGDRISGLIGYKARNTEACIDVDRVNYYDPSEFWERVYRPDRGGIILARDDFHILVSKELIAVPRNFAADMVAYDTLVGEFRVHYAGFFDPGFGLFGAQPRGTPAVLEVRSHEVPFMIEDGQVVGRLVFERLTEETEKPYGAEIGSSYQSQGLTLSKHFKSSFS